jgi:hypothetical protein
MHPTCGIRAILVRWYLLTVGAITLVGASPPQAGDGQLVSRFIKPRICSTCFTYRSLSLDDILIPIQPLQV